MRELAKKPSGKKAHRARGKWKEFIIKNFGIEITKVAGCIFADVLVSSDLVRRNKKESILFKIIIIKSFASAGSALR